MVGNPKVLALDPFWRSYLYYADCLNVTRGLPVTFTADDLAAVLPRGAAPPQGCRTVQDVVHASLRFLDRSPPPRAALRSSQDADSKSSSPLDSAEEVAERMAQRFLERMAELGVRTEEDLMRVDTAADDADGDESAAAAASNADVPWRDPSA